MYEKDFCLLGIGLRFFLELNDKHVHTLENRL